MANTRKQAPQATEAEGAPEPQAEAVAETVALKRCKDHPANFPNEDPMRPLSEFYGKAKHVYCKRCENIRGKARRVLLKTQADPYGGELALYKMPSIIREAQSRIAVAVPIPEAIAQVMQDLRDALPGVQAALEHRLTPADGADEAEDIDEAEEESEA